jgi:hypothetical protein
LLAIVVHTPSSRTAREYVTYNPSGKVEVDPGESAGRASWSIVATMLDVRVLIVVATIPPRR